MADVLFIVFPYVAVILAVGVGLYRYFRRRYSYSSLSSQLLENRALFWGSVPWHYGITLILLAHLGVWLFPGAAAVMFSDLKRLLALELAGLALAFYCVFGIAVLILRRLPTESRARAVTSWMDWILLFCLLIQTATGAGIALFERWGSAWYLSTAVPWLWSLIRLEPDASTVIALPGIIQFHFVFGFVIILLFPFSRLVHIFAIPLDYLWRPYQVVVWNQPQRARRVQPPVRIIAGGAPDDPAADSSGHPAGEPVSATPPAAPDLPPGELERRRFLAKLSVVVGAIGTAIIALPSIGFLLGLRKAPALWRPLGKVEDFRVGETVEVSFMDSSPLPWSGVTAKTAAWLRRNSEQEFIAFAINCTHLGCPVRWLQSADLFMCPCHGGVFYNDGRVASGPPPRRLFTYPVRVNNGVVEILASPLPISTG